MANYPFDEKFNATVKELPAWKDDAWDSLINYPNRHGPILEALTEAGYPAETVLAYVNALLNQPFSELIELALADYQDASPALLVLQRSDSRDVFDRAVKLCESEVTKERALGVLVLMRTPGRTYHEEAVQAVARLAAVENEDTVMAALAYALCHLDVEDHLDLRLRAATSPDPETRFAAAYSLGSISDDCVIESKIALTRDSDEDIRDWATFGLHLSLKDEQKTRQDVRDAFHARITDSHEETRYEALLGLAKCKDTRVLEPLIAALESPEVWDMAVEAASEMDHRSLYPSLIALKERLSGSSHSDLDEAIAKCTAQNE